MRGQTQGILITLTLFAATVFAEPPRGGSARATVTVRAYVLPKSTCTLGFPRPAGTAASSQAVRCEVPPAQPNPVVQMEPVEPGRPDAPKTVLTVLP
ncbi:MAG: hypothetical protein NZ742_10540 [Acidobacteria bacterium]|nr:hypothetical protein [Acidobacteriota bacterium]MDW7983207.1 hypothetical protein [Acidobacteriota bacterium]